MNKSSNEIYALVDENFLSRFSENHLNFMEQYYYDYYKTFCNNVKRRPLAFDDFYKNMHRRRFQFYQLCCPYCGTIALSIHDKKISKESGFNYCHNCGRTSTLDNIKRQLARFIRINRMNRISLQIISKEKSKTEQWLIAYDSYQMEIIELASIIEVLFRDYFEALFFISNIGTKNDFIGKIIRKYAGNDFMNIEKSNDLYKKAYGIEIRKSISSDVWNDLVDIVNLRNMIVHNNGRVDKRFEMMPTYQRWKERIEEPLIRIEDEDIAKFLSSTITAITVISNLYLHEYYHKRNKVIANYYFNADSKGVAQPAK